MFASGLSEIVLIVSDVRRAHDFYRDIVGLALASDVDDDWAWFWTGAVDRSARLALHRGTLLFEEHSPLPPGQRFGPLHYAFQVDREKLPAAVKNVRDRGITVYGPVRQGWMQADSFYFYDLDGNLLEWWSPDPGRSVF